MTGPVRAGVPPAASGVAVTPDALAEALELEDRLIGELLEIVREQRAGVAAEDVDRVNDSVFAAHRVVRTMNEARRRRRTLLDALTGSEDASLDELEASLGPAMTDRIRAVRERVRARARILSREIAVNRKILQDALRGGDAYMRALFGGTLASTSYDAGARPVGDVAHGGVLINRQV